MLPLGMVLLWAGYGVASWGYVLNKGYNISLRQWFSPIHPWTGDISKAGPIPPGRLFPGKGASGPQNSQNAGAAGSNTGSGGQATQIQQKGRGATQKQQTLG